jgi:DNA-binding transcriptional LysR family regulator
MVSIEDLRLAVTLAHSESLSAAARRLNVTPPALSMRLRKLEALLDVQLANRDARRLSLTAEGERFATQAATLLQQLEALPEAFSGDTARLSGTLRLAAPFGFGRQRIAPLLSAFAARHPQVRVQLDLRETPWPDRHDSDAVVHIGRINDSSWVARTLAGNERWLCASPEYLAAWGTPQAPEQLSNHRCLCIRENEEDVTLWHLRKGAVRRALRIEPAMLSNDGSVARQWAEQGQGLVLRSEWDVGEAIAAGRLVRVLADWSFESAPVLLLVPSRKHQSARLRALSTFLIDAFKP